MNRELKGQTTFADYLGMEFGRMYPGRYQATTEKIFEPCWKSLQGSQSREFLFLSMMGGWQPAGLIEGNGWQIAWRIHDAQYWGVAQRRRRIALVVDFDGYNAAAIVFDDGGDWRKTGRRCNPRQAERYIGEKPAEQIRPVKSGDQRDYSQTERKEQGHTARTAGGNDVADGTRLTLYENHAQDARIKRCDDVAPQVSATYGMGGNNTPLVVEEGGSFCIDHQISTEVSGALACGNHGFVCDPITDDEEETTVYITDHSGTVTENAQVAKTVDRHGISPITNQGGV